MPTVEGSAAWVCRHAVETAVRCGDPELASGGNMSDLLQKLSWDDLRIVGAIGEKGSLVAAAQALGVNHSTLTRRLGIVEKALGTPLFDRHRSGYVPTVAGTDILALASRVELDISSVTRRVSGRSQGLKGDLRITTSDALLLDFLTPIIGDYQRQNPGIRVEVIVSNKPLNLARGESDIALRATIAPPENLVGRKLATVAWAIYGRRNDFVGSTPTRDALFRTRWAGYGKGVSRLMAYAFVNEHVCAENIAYRSDSVTAVASAVAAGIGIGILPCMHADLLPSLVRVSPVVTEVYDELWILTHPDIRKSERVTSFMAHCSRVIGEQIDFLEGRESN